MGATDSIFANIVKGILKKGAEAGPEGKNDFPKITWAQEKIIKHRDAVTLKKAQIGTREIWYKLPYELLHTYDELFIKQIYKFTSDTEQPVIIDCGANIGVSVLYFKALYPDAVIYAYEADVNNFSILQKNITANRLENVECFNKAVWIHDNGVSFDAAGTEASRISEEEQVVNVASVRLSKYLEDMPRIDFLKMDIEGAEYAVLSDCKESLRKISNMFIEYHGTAAEASKLIEILQIINNAGFELYIKNAADLLHHPFVEKRTGTIYDVQLNIFCYRKAG